MNRFLKQLIYGSLFALFWVGVAFGSYFLFLKPPECAPGEALSADNLCIPICETCELEVLYDEARVIPIDNVASTIILKFQNSSSDFGLKKFNYSLDIFSKFGPLIRTIVGEALLYPGEESYIVESGLSINPDDIGVINFKTGELQWEKAAEFGRAPQIVISGIQYRDSINSKILEGIIENKSDRKISRLIISAVGYDAYSTLYGAATTEIKDFYFGDKEKFTIFLPGTRYKNIEVFYRILPE